jgi:oligopeptide/dipeptide ABC transporter ATP-binding protein
MSLLDIRDVSIEYQLEKGTLEAVSEVSLAVEAGETVGIVGESGCGKTTMTKSILGLLDDNGAISGGEITYKGETISEFSEPRLREEIRWQEVSYIPQNAMASLDPVHTVGAQMKEVIRAHTDQTKKEAHDRSAELFERVGLEAARLRDYPHELSGGQRQRVTIALSLALTPSLIIADEPTTGLDVVVQDEIMNLLDEIQQDIGCAILFVTHDMSVIAEVSDRVVVMYAGRTAEVGSITDVFVDSAHPYTIGLQNAFPKMEYAPAFDSLVSIPGSPPDLSDPPHGCRFADRCPWSTAECIEHHPPEVEVDDGHTIECHYPGEADRFREEGSTAGTWQDVQGTSGTTWG